MERKQSRLEISRGTSQGTWTASHKTTTLKVLSAIAGTWSLLQAPAFCEYMDF